MGINERQTEDAIRVINPNFNGNASKSDVVETFKLMISKSMTSSPQQYQVPNQNSQNYTQMQQAYLMQQQMGYNPISATYGQYMQNPYSQSQNYVQQLNQGQFNQQFYQGNYQNFKR